MTPAAFSKSFPDLRDASPVVVKAKLAQAAARMGGPDFGVWPAFGTDDAPSLTDIAQGNLAAHYLWTSPAGSATLLNQVKGPARANNPYWDVWEECQVMVALGGTVAGMGATPPITAPPGSPKFQTGFGTAGVTNGSTAVTFSSAQTFAAGTLFVFYSQPGVIYTLAIGILGAMSATLTAPYEGPTAPATTWAF
jgi:hypothetical protein